MEHFWSVLGEVKGWLGEMERRYEACGPIGAHLERLLEQGPILQVGVAREVCRFLRGCIVCLPLLQNGCVSKAYLRSYSNDKVCLINIQFMK